MLFFTLNYPESLYTSAPFFHFLIANGTFFSIAWGGKKSWFFIMCWCSVTSFVNLVRSCYRNVSISNGGLTHVSRFLSSCLIVRLFSWLRYSTYWVTAESSISLWNGCPASSQPTEVIQGRINMAKHWKMLSGKTGHQLNEHCSPIVFMSYFSQENFRKN